MFNTNNNALKLSKKKYINILKSKDISSYLLHEKITNSLNRSRASANLDTTVSKSNVTRSLVNSYHKLPVNENEKNDYKIKKCSYTDFLSLRNTKINAPFNFTEERFKWQNLDNESAVVDPTIYTRPHKKQFLLKETFGEGMLAFLNKDQIPENKPKIQRIRQFKTDIGNHIQNVDIDVSKRVVNPEYNNEQPKFKTKKRSLSMENNFHRTDGKLSSLFNITPLTVENKYKKRYYKDKGYCAESINIFSNNYPKRELPSNTKKLIYDNRCYFDTIKHEDLMFEMNNCWKNGEDFGKKRRRWSLDEKCLSKKGLSLKNDCDVLNLRDEKYGFSFCNWNNRNVGKIRRK
jgi:hypothetical protein